MIEVLSATETAARAEAIVNNPANAQALREAHDARVSAVADYHTLLRAMQPHLPELPDTGLQKSTTLY